MELGVIGLGRMGGNIVRRLHRAGHHCVVYDANPKAVADLAAIGATPATSLADLASKLKQSTKAAWVMLPAGERPAYVSIVPRRLRYIVACTPRGNGGSPGRPRSRSSCTAFVSAGV